MTITVKNLERLRATGFAVGTEMIERGKRTVVTKIGPEYSTPDGMCVDIETVAKDDAVTREPAFKKYTSTAKAVKRIGFKIGSEFMDGRKTMVITEIGPEYKSGKETVIDVFAVERSARLV